MTERSALAKAAGILASVAIISKVLGFVREASLASVFGATGITDAYFVGQTIPGLVFASVGAALATTFIPVYAQVQRERGREGAFAMVDSVIGATVLASVVCIGLGELLAGPLTDLVAPGFRGPVYGLTVDLTRVMFPMVLFQVLNGVLMGILQTEGNFLAPAAVNLSYNLLVIGSILVLGPRFGITGVAWGTVAAVFTQMAFQAPALSRLGYRWRPRLNLRDPGLLRIAKLSLPVLIGTSVGQMGLIVDRVLASGLPQGSIAALNYANKLMLLVPAVLGSAIATVMYPTLARLTAEGDWDRYGTAFSEAVRLINFLMIPVAVGMAVLSVPLVRLAFERGAFDASATAATSWALLFFSLGVAGYSLRDMVSRAFYAFQDTMAPMIIGAGAVALNILLNPLLVGHLRQGGLALATSLATVAGSGTMLWFLGKRVKRVSGGRSSGIGGQLILNSLWRVTLASLVMGGAVWAAQAWLSARAVGAGPLAQTIRLSGAVFAGVVVYAVMVFVLRVPEAQAVVNLGRTVRKRAVTMLLAGARVRAGVAK